ncbi:hypothetical protein [Luteibacter yeojuensis]|uniref:Uncharacterized protein n=1 Tax=Luteibacter yeojuensis TaxID=345309 RepID=A0A7X5QY22_9GAMM|nr:hypothetical protein [Luteibacter yeojuensis]NID17445.1 hypothetical protein [Luteibacter yeojuensis]
MKSVVRTALPWAVIVAVAAVAALTRYAFIEPPPMAHACEAQGGPWWCGVREAVVQGFLHNAYGYAAVLAALLAVFWRHTFAAALAVCLGAIALQLYCYEGGALAVLIGTLRLVRVQYGGKAMSPPCATPAAPAGPGRG